MMAIETVYEYIKENLTEKRFLHTMGVISVAKKLSNINNISEEKAELAALCHDIAKYVPKEECIKLLKENNIKLSEDEEKVPEIWHSIIGPILAKNNLEIEDKDVLGAIRWHTTGKEDMSVLEKIIYIADMIEPSRIFDGVDEIREATMLDLNKGVLLGLNHSIKFLLSKGVPIDLNTIKARNYLIRSINN